MCPEESCPQETYVFLTNLYLFALTNTIKLYKHAGDRLGDVYGILSFRNILSVTAYETYAYEIREWINCQQGRPHRFHLPRLPKQLQ